MLAPVDAADKLQVVDAKAVLPLVVILVAKSKRIAKPASQTFQRNELTHSSTTELKPLVAMTVAADLVASPVVVCWPKSKADLHTSSVIATQELAVTQLVVQVELAALVAEQAIKVVVKVAVAPTADIAKAA